MNTPLREHNTRERVKAIAAAVWLLAVASSLAWSWHQIDHAMAALAESAADSSFAKDLVYRKWAAMHGGVYVPPTALTPPNPHLSHLPHRDVVTTAGQRLTLVNPAYMTRQVHELGQREYGLRGHITSLRPLRPENAADPWEAEALRSFAAGAARAVTEIVYDGEPHFRLMRPLTAEAGCLKCHREQGYREGDQMGGISVSVPLAPYRQVGRRQQLLLLAAHFGIGALGLMGLLAGAALLGSADQAVRESEQRYRLLAHQSLSGIMVLELVRGPDGVAVDARLVSANEAFAAQTGLSAEQSVGRLVSELIPGLEPEVFAKLQQRVVIDGEALNFERYCEHLHRDFQISAYRLSDDQLAMVLTDISERKRAEAVLLASEQRYRLLFETMQEGFALHELLVDDDGRPTDYRFLDINPAFERLTGLRRDDLLGRCVREVLPGTEDHWITTYGRVALTGQPIEFEQFSSELNRWYHVQAYQTEPGQFAVVIVDTTERRLLEEQLRQAQKMEAVGQLAGGIAHDFNNLLQVISGYNAAAAEALPPDHPVQADLAEVAGASDRAAELVGQLLAFGRRQLLRLAVLDVNDVLAALQRMLTRVIGERIQVTVAPAEAPALVRGDRGQIEQALLNLALNARDAMPEGGSLRFEVSRASLDAEAAQVAGCDPGDYWVVSVADTGVGMDAHLLARIWEPFYTTKGVGKGTGLGLATVYGIVQQHEGWATVDSEVGVGTRFRLGFPVATATDPAET